MASKIQSWTAIEIVCAPHATEAIESAFNQLDALGTEIDSLRKARDEPLTVSGYFETAPDMAEIEACVGESLRIYGFSADAVLSIGLRDVEQTDWLAEWKRHWKATEIGRFVIAPPWEDVDAAGKFVIRIEPNMAFGTGTHETTKLCVRKIDELYRPEQTFLDVGTGTGILAIAAAKLGGTAIIACDTDRDSVVIARENAVLNGVADAIEFFEGSIDDTSPVFDFVCANLTIDVILPLLDLLLAKTGKLLLLSGILGFQKYMIVDALTARGKTEPVIDADGEWISVLVRAA
ncbi:MAG: 50S ribosomal protein L11 methyltransferase [Acidobacteriota bacterium]